MKKNELIKDIMFFVKELDSYEIKLAYRPITDIISKEMGRKEKKKHPVMRKKAIIEEIERDLQKMKFDDIANICREIRFRTNKILIKERGASYPNEDYSSMADKALDKIMSSSTTRFIPKDVKVSSSCQGCVCLSKRVDEIELRIQEFLPYESAS